MELVADLHIHSRFSRATSKELDLEHLWVWAQRKGVGLVGTGDFTHPGWFSELEQKLVDDGSGLLALRPALAAALAPQVPRACAAPTRSRSRRKYASLSLVRSNLGLPSSASPGPVRAWETGPTTT